MTVHNDSASLKLNQISNELKPAGDDQKVKVAFI